MDKAITIKNLLQALPVIVSVYFGIHLLLMKNFRVQSNKILATFFFLVALILGARFLVSIRVPVAVMIMSFAVICVAIPPTLFLYVRSLTSFQRIAIHKNLVHYIPATWVALVNSFGLWLTFWVDADNKPFQEFMSHLIYYTNAGAIFVVFAMQNIVYITGSFILYWRHRKNIGNIFSYEEGIDLKWMQVFIGSFVVLVVGIYAIKLTNNTMADVSFSLFILAYLSFVGYSGSKQMDIFYGARTQSIEETNIETDKEPLSSEIVEPSASDVQNESQPVADVLNEGVFETIKKDLVKAMEEDKPYLNTQLTIYDLAKQINTNSKYLSKVINTEFEQSFVNFINTYRIKEAQNFFNDAANHHLKIEAIAEMTGFKSKSAFNAAFKKITGQTPSAYRETAILSLS